MKSPRQKAKAAKRHHRAPSGNAPPERRHAHEQHQRIEGQKVAGEQRATQNRKEQRVRDEDPEEREDVFARKSGAGAAVRARSLGGSEKERCAGAQDRHKEIHVRGEMNDAMQERQEDAEGREVASAL